MRRPVIALALVLAACSAGDDDADDAVNLPDAGPGQDAPIDMNDAGSNPCVPELYLPEGIELGQPIEARVEFQPEATTSGLVTWTVERPNESDYPTPRPTYGPQTFVFTPEDVGSWEIRVDVEGCGAQQPGLVYVEHPDARQARYRLQFTPLPTHELPAQVGRPIVVHGGGPFELPIDVALESGVALNDVLRLDSGEPLEAQLSLEAPGVPRLLVYSDIEGKYSGTIEFKDYQVTVVPLDEALASARLTLSSDTLASGFSIARGRAVEGTVVGPGGAPVIGALVALSVGDLPASFATTDSQGQFSGWAREPGALSVRVRPSNDSLPELHADASFGLSAGGGDLAIELPAATPVTAGLKITSAAGVPLVGASVTFVGEGAVGQMSQGLASKAARHASRRQAISGADGNLSQALPSGRYQVIVVPPAGSGEAMLVQSIDLTSTPGAPVVLKTGAPTATKIQVVDDKGLPVQNARVLAVSRGLSGVGAGIAVPGTGDDVSTLQTLALVPGLAYDVLIIPPAGRGFLARSVVLPAATNGTTEVALSRGLSLRGRLVTPGGQPARGVRVSAFCVDCATPDVELDETATTQSGEFRIRVEDPGVSP